MPCCTQIVLTETAASQMSTALPFSSDLLKGIDTVMRQRREPIIHQCMLMHHQKADMIAKPTKTSELFFSVSEPDIWE